MIKLAPSIISGDFADLKKTLLDIENAKCEYVHLDVMDGNFVPNITFGAMVIKALRKHTDLFFDTHLMIDKPSRYIKDFADAGSDCITVHYESEENIENVLKSIRALGKKAGISIKPKTPVDVLKPLLPFADMILIMTVEPGFGGQKFMYDVVDKISQARNLINESGLDIDLQVDGGVNPETAAIVANAGANILVAGSAILAKPDISAAAADIRKAAEENYKG